MIHMIHTYHMLPAAIASRVASQHKLRGLIEEILLNVPQKPQSLIFPGDYWWFRALRPIDHFIFPGFDPLSAEIEHFIVSPPSRRGSSPLN